MSGEPLTLSYNQLKTYLVNSYNTLAGTSTTTGQVDARNWTGASSTLDGVIFEVNKFITENPNHTKVRRDALGNSTAEELVMECQELKKDIASIQDFLSRTNNAASPEHQLEYNDSIVHFKERLQTVANRFSA